jgi:hypothetical protein
VELRETTRKLIAEVERQTGCRVAIVRDGTLSTMSGVSMAGPERVDHLVRIHPDAPGGVDYYAIYYCRMIQRFFENPPEERFVLGYGEKGRYRVRKLVQRTRIGRMVGEAALLGVCEQLVAGLLSHLRSVPIGMRVDNWILNELPELADMQKDAIEPQLQENGRSANENIRNTVPSEVFDATMAINVAFAHFWAEKWGQPELTLSYKAAGYATTGEKLFSLFQSTPDSGRTDCALIDAWAKVLNVADWYVWVPYQGPQLG